MPLRGIFLIAHQEQQVEAGPTPALLWYLPAPGPCKSGALQPAWFGPADPVPAAPSPGAGWDWGSSLEALCALPAQGQVLIISCTRVPQFPPPQPVTRSSFPLQWRWLVPAAVPVLQLLLLMRSAFSFPWQSCSRRRCRHRRCSSGSLGGGKGKREQEEDEVRLQHVATARLMLKI